VRLLPIGSIINDCKIRSQGSKTGSLGYILNLQIAVNDAKMARATGFKLSTYGVGDQEYKSRSNGVISRPS